MEDKPEEMMGVAGNSILTHCFEQHVELDAEKLAVIVGCNKQTIISHYGDDFNSVPITCAHQRAVLS